MNPQKLLHKLAKHRYYEAHKNRILAEQRVENSKQKLLELTSTKNELSYLCNDYGIITFAQQCKALHQRNIRHLNNAKDNLTNCIQERCKWQILESNADRRVIADKKRAIGEIEDDMLQTRYQKYKCA